MSGKLVEIAVEKGRKTKPGMKMGVCGEHGGDPASIQFFHKVGLTLRVLLAVPRAHRASGGGVRAAREAGRRLSRHQTLGRCGAVTSGPGTRQAAGGVPSCEGSVPPVVFRCTTVGGMAPAVMTMRIHRLPDDLVNKIAAGEVVERPASVVKELVENALDAEARNVHVDVEGGGRVLIRVRDDGSGMSRQDAELALERHATSKLSSLSDLEAIATNGFRGEALPSIASVCHLTLRTREEATTAGTEIEVEHGRFVGIRDVGHPRGTTVEARDLFGAVPARRKFLRAESTETGHVAEVVTLLGSRSSRDGFRSSLRSPSSR